MATRVISRRLVERQAELELLTAALDEAVAGRPTVTMILGEAGLGKTRLLREVESAARGRGMMVLRGECFQLEGGELPYAPLDAALGDVPEAALGRAAADLPRGAREELVRTFPSLWTIGESPAGSVEEDARTKLYRGLLGLLDALGRESPVLLAIEDLHGVDRATRDFLRVLVHDRRRERVACVMTYRTDDLDPDDPAEHTVLELAAHPHVQEVRLERLSREGLTRQLADILGEPPPAVLVEELHRRSKGNPFFAEELVAAYRADRTSEVPAKINRAALPRLNGVSETARQVLDALAVIARPVGADLLGGIVGLDARVVDAALREAMRHSLIVSAPGHARVAFRHELVREAAYHELMARSAELHLAVAQGLSRSPGNASHAELAHHWRRGRRPVEALEASLAAGLEAQAAHAFADAARHLDDALDLWGAAGDAVTRLAMDRIDVLGHLADAAKHSGDYARAERLCRDALAELPPDRDVLRVALFHERLGRLQSSRCDEALASYRTALRHVPPDRPVLRARLLSEEADALAGVLDFEGARTRCEEALALAEQEGAVAEIAYARSVLGLTLASAGDPTTGEGHLRAALALPPDAVPDERRLRAHLYLGEVFRLDGRYDAAQAAMRDGCRLAHELGMEATFGWFMAINAALDLLNLGRWDEADALLAGVRDRPLHLWSEVLLRQATAQLSLARGDLEHAREQLWAARDVCADAPPDCMPEVYAAFAELRLVERAHDDARALIQEALDAVGTALETLYVPALFSMGARVEADAAEAARDGRRPDAAVEAHARAADHLRRLEALLGPHDDEQRPPTARAHLATCAAEVARAAAASDGPTRAPAHAAWAAAVAAWDAVTFPYPAAYARRRLAEASLAAGQQRDGARALREAYTAAKGLGAEVLVRDVELLARRSRIALDEEPQRRRRRRDPERAAHELTTRELDVLALVAEGRTDREIAARLFITHKTASHHVSHILTKLSVRTRNEAAAWALRQGLMDSGAPGSSAAR